MHTHTCTQCRQFFRDLPYLERIDFSNNKLTGSIPHTLWDLSPLLNTIMLGGNLLAGSIPHMDGLRFLTTLNVRDNRLTGGTPRLPPSLRILDVSFNALGGPINGSTLFLPSLSVAYLQGNAFSGSLPDAPKASLPLTAVDVSDNMLSGTVPATWSRLSGTLKSAKFAGNFISGALSRQLVEMFIIPQELASAHADPGVYVDLTNTCISWNANETFDVYNGNVSEYLKGSLDLRNTAVSQCQDLQ